MTGHTGNRETRTRTKPFGSNAQSALSVPPVLTVLTGLAALSALAPVLAGCSAQEIAGAPPSVERGSGPSQVMPNPDSGGQGTAGLLSLKLNLVSDISDSAVTPQVVSLAHDPVFSRPAKYEALPLVDVLRLSPDFQRIEASGRIDAYGLTFEALDRFKVTIPLKRALTGKAFLARKELDRADGRDWDFIGAQAQPKTPAPYYLIWNVAEIDTTANPAPYQIAIIEVAPFKDIYAQAYPKNPSKEAGFQSFAYNLCNSCHAVNFSGGRSARELNVPMNLSEQGWDYPKFRKHIHGELAYEKPPGCTKLWPRPTDGELTNIWDYIQHMKTEKICASVEECKQFDYR